MVQGKWFPVGSDIAQALCVRQAVLGRGRDALDDESQQVAVYNEDGLPVGAARLRWADGAFRLDDVCVLEGRRGRGFGDLLVRLCLFKALTHGASVIALDAPADVAPFFARYGFAPPIGGEMTLRAQDVRLSHCGGNCAACQSPSPECAQGES